ncbi:VOC family protein [Actinotalea fermentans]|nr:VOC family protein [Actinotalea fermentans]KGM16463.1 glyoxalase [Actinotalea fermentans ATCC 43279 = JCM 9966 = DSM 3133]
MEPHAAAEPAVSPSQAPVTELRLAVTVEDWAAAVAFYRDTLGLPQLADFSSADGRVVLLDAGRATLELFDADQAALVDDLEVGRRVAPAIRVALRVPDADAAARRLAEAGADVVAEPTATPWGSRNARLDGPGLHLTVFSGGE